ncbi:hypothetical protein BaRGS_00002108 [Batillaria attramentaria]|uniref:Uncharacterized protein n=1 Tax=Batillaria attramentaria TaxID=370345 RepID=A0ABD0M4I2_9CAEN
MTENEQLWGGNSSDLIGRRVSRDDYPNGANWEGETFRTHRSEALLNSSSYRLERRWLGGVSSGTIAVSRPLLPGLDCTRRPLEDDLTGHRVILQPIITVTPVERRESADTTAPLLTGGWNNASRCQATVSL